MSMIYLILGSTGEYEDYNEWVVKAFRVKNTAERWLSTCQGWADKYLKDEQNYTARFQEFFPDSGYSFTKPNTPEADRYQKFLSDYPEPNEEDYAWADENFHMDYTGTTYRIEEVKYDTCPNDGMYTPQSHYCQDCNGGA